MKQLLSLMLITLALTACLPILGGDGATLSLVREGPEVTATFNAGPEDAISPVLVVAGEDVSSLSGACQPLGDKLVCELGQPRLYEGEPVLNENGEPVLYVPAGSSVTVRVNGQRVSANLTFYRAGSRRPVYLEP